MKYPLGFFTVGMTASVILLCRPDPPEFYVCAILFTTVVTTLSAIGASMKK